MSWGKFKDLTYKGIVHKKDQRIFFSQRTCFTQDHVHRTALSNKIWLWGNEVFWGSLAPPFLFILFLSSKNLYLKHIWPLDLICPHLDFLL